MKMLPNILLELLIPFMGEVFGDSHIGLHSYRPTVDQIFCIKSILEKKWDKWVSTVATYVELGEKCCVKCQLNLKF